MTVIGSLLFESVVRDHSKDHPMAVAYLSATRSPGSVHHSAGRNYDLIDPEGFRTEMVNLFRWQAETDLGYAYTARIPMRMTNNVTIYDMVFCTDHPAGESIMSSLYQKAAEREPRMREELRLKRLNEVAENSLFDVTPDMLASSSDQVRWTHMPPWNPREADWWN